MHGKKQNKRRDEDFVFSCAVAAEVIGVSEKTLIRKAQAGLVEHRRRGRSQKPRYYFHPDDVESLRVEYSVGYALS